MNRKNCFKTLSAFFMLLALAFGCQPVSEEKPTANTGNTGTNPKKTFTITFDANSGTGEMKALTVEEGKSVELTENAFTKDGYDFDGWAKDKSSTKADYLDKASIEAKGNMTLYALWKARKVTITFDANGGSGTAPEKIETTSDKTAALSSMTASNFSHWNTEKDGSGESYRESGNFTKDTTLYAIYLQAGEYKIIYHLDGGVNNPENPLVLRGEELRLREPTREGYSFIGWEDKGGNKSSWVDKNRLEVWAVWAKQTYKIVLHSNCDELEDVTIPFAQEEHFVEIWYPFSRDDYTFDKWYTDAACTKEPDSRELESNLIIVHDATADIHFYAGWKKNVYIHDLTIRVMNLPSSVKALSFWGNLNEWKYDNIMADKDAYIVDVVNGVAHFVFDKCNIVVPLWCQFVPMTSKDMILNDGTWWQIAFSGSSEYANAENNLVYNFAEQGFSDGMALTLDVKKVYGDVSNVFDRRFTTDDYTGAFTAALTGIIPTLPSGIYTITYHSKMPMNTTFFNAETKVTLETPRSAGYDFLGWYDNEDFRGEPITGWNAGEKKANVELWAKWEKVAPEVSELAKGGEGVYSYTVNIEDISSAWAGTTASPAFTIMLLTDEQLENCKAEENFCVAFADTPEYQIYAYGNMKLADTSDTGNFAIYGQNVVDDVFQYYTGVAATVTETTLTVTIDMTKLIKTDLKANCREYPAGVFMTNDDIIDLTGYKPYILALGSEDTDPDNYQMTGWIADLMAMAPGATFPAGELIKGAPVVPTCYNLTHYAGTMSGWVHEELIDNAFDFTFTVDSEITLPQNPAFAFSNGSWDFKACGVEIDALDTEFQLREGDDDNIIFADGVLTTGETYTVTLIVKGNHEAYVKVSKK